MTRFILRLCALLLLGLASSAHAQAPRVLASILPLQSLAANVLAGVGEADLLIPANQSPHDYLLKPSDSRRLHDTDLLLWVGPDLEGTLSRHIKRLPRSARQLVVMEMDGLRQLASRSGGVGAHHHDHGSTDPHVWLDPVNAERIVEGLADMLGEVDPANSARYAANAARTLNRIRAAKLATRDRLSPLPPASFLVYHDAYQYFESAFGLRSAGNVTTDEDVQPGGRRVVELRRHIRLNDIACVLHSYAEPPALARRLVAGTDTRIVALDPLGSGLRPGPDAWFELLDAATAAFEQCFRETG